MTVFVDALVEYAPPKDGQTRRAGARHGHRWAHMFTDSADLAELHAMAQRIGLKPEWAQEAPGKLAHYDLTPPRRAAAVAAGAVECGRAKLVECIRAARARAQAVAERFPDVPFQPGDGDRRARDLQRLRGPGGPLQEEHEPDLVELMERDQEESA